MSQPGVIERIRNLWQMSVRAHPSQADEWLISLGQAEASSGATVTTDTAISNTAVFACVRILAETVASLPLILYRRLSDGGKERAPGHPLFDLLHRLPNPEMSSVELRETLMGHLGLWGNAYLEIESNRAGRIVGLWPLRPDKVRKYRLNRQIFYEITMPKGGMVQLPANRVMHIRGLGYDGMVGYSPVALAREAIGMALATEQYGSRFFGNGARPGIVLEHPGKLSDEALNRLQRSVEQRHQGLENAHRLMILEEGMGVKEIGMPPQDAQFLESRKFQTQEIARLYRIPPHMLADLERATFSNIEHQSLEFVMHTIQPWLQRWEQAIYRDLLLPRERTEIFAEHLVDALLRGDIQSRYQAYATARQNGWMSANDIRELENMNPIDGGDVYLVPLNMVPASMVTEQPLATETTEPAAAQRLVDTRTGYYAGDREERAKNVAKQRQRLANSWQRVILDTCERVTRREINDVQRAINKFFKERDASQFSEWLEQFYRDHKEFWIRQILPILLAYADQLGVTISEELGGEPRTADEIRAFIDQFGQALADRNAGDSHLQLQALLDRALIDGQDPVPVLEERLGDWEQTRPAKLALRESYLAGNAMAKAFYVLVGVERLRWVATGDNCPYCRDLDGKVVGINQFFLAAGQDFSPDGADRPINKRHNVGHPPVHNGCDCAIVAER